MAKRRIQALLVLAFAILPPLAICQGADPNPSQTGIVPYGTYDSNDIDSVNMSNGQLTLKIPLYSLPQRGGLALSFSLVANSIWYEEGNTCLTTPPHTCTPIYAAAPASPTLVMDQGATVISTPQINITPQNDVQRGYVHTVTDATGAVHYLAYDPSTNYTTLRSFDGSGYLEVLTDPLAYKDGATGTLYSPNGVKYLCQSNCGTVTAGGPPEVNTMTDPNGNQITNSVSTTSTQTTDTLNRSLVSSWSLSNVSSTVSALCPQLNYPNQPLTGSYNWVVPGQGGGTTTFTFCYTTYYIGPANTGLLPQTSIQSVVLPNGTYWAFEYNATTLAANTFSMGYITQVRRPDGGITSYTWGASADGCSTQSNSPVGPPAYQTVFKRIINPINGPSENWQYSYNFPASDTESSLPYTTSVTRPDGNQSVYTFTPLSNAAYNTPASACDAAETERQDYQGTAATGTLLQTVSKSWTTELNPITVGNVIGPSLYPFLQSTTTTLNTGLSTTTTYSYDSGFSGSLPICLTAEDQVTCGFPSTPELLGAIIKAATTGYDGSAIRTSNITYQWQVNSSYYASGLMLLPQSVSVTGSGGNSSTTTYSYDQDNGSPQGVIGNLTSVTRQVSPTSSVSTQTVYNSQGMPTLSTDGDGNKTSISSYQCDGTFPQQITYAYQSTTTLPETYSYVYDCNLGKLTSVTDPNSQAITTSYDEMGRTTKIGYPDTGSVQISYNGDPTPPKVTVTTTTGESSGSIVQTFLYDGLGRQTESQVNTDPIAPDLIDTTYTPVGQVSSVSNPYRSITDATYGITKYSYDGLGRMISQTDSDGVNTKSWIYSGNTVTYSDEMKNQWKQTSDAVGRLTSVFEPNGVATAPSMETDYTYDSLNNLLSVTQWGGVSGSSGARTRSFSYDSLSRLLSATNPETGMVSYTYDANSNVITKKDARNITTTRTYDALNRLTKKSYSDGVTPELLYGYDGTSISFVPVPSDPARNVQVSLKNTIGRMIYASTVGLSLEVFSYDPMGRIASRWSTTPSFNAGGSVAQVSATYDLAGNRTSLTNSTGRTFNYSYDGAGRLQSASNTVTLNGTPATTPMVSSMAYYPSGQPQTMTTDTGGATITGTWSVDNRLRVTSYQNLSTANTAGTNYGYSLSYTANSNVLTDAETVYNPASGAKSWSWTFGYDTLNRLTSAQSAGAVQLGCGWTYDAFGNRLSQAPSGTGLTCTSVSTPVNTNNRLSNPIYSYDAAGDTLTEGGNTLTYDAEGRILTAGSTSYLYDAAGQRVSKTSGGVETDFVRDFDGTLLDTYVSGSNINQPQEMWIAGIHYGTVYPFVSNGVQEQAEGLSLTNWLGSEAMRSFPTSNGTNTGVPTYAFLSLPFGDGQTTLIGSDNDDIHFTGKERDTETSGNSGNGNDYFGARYYANTLGRWISPDYSDAPEPIPFGNLLDPQSHNLYSYVENNPVANIDSDGHGCADDGTASDKSGGAVRPSLGCQILNFLSSLFGGTGSSSPGAAPPPPTDGLLDFYAAQQQSQYGRQPDGSYKAPTGPGSDIYNRLHGGKNDPVGPHGECVDACRHFSGAPASSSWTLGRPVTGLNDTTDIGLAIASFGPNGRYAQPGGDQNSAIYMGHNSAGQIMVVDQWPPPNKPQYNAPFLHPLANYGPNSTQRMENNAFFYHVIVVP